jgi:hypothetical protein
MNIWFHTQQKREGTSMQAVSPIDRNYFGLTLDDLNGQHKYRYKDVLVWSLRQASSSLALMTTVGIYMEQTYVMVPR